MGPRIKIRAKLLLSSIYSIKALLNVFKDVACLTDVGNVFHCLGAETVNEPV